MHSLQPNEKLTIREIGPKDNAAVAAIIREVMTGLGAVGPGYSINDPEVDAMCEAYNKPRSKYFVVVDEVGVAVGGAGIGPLVGGEADICELKKMYLLPAARGNG